jgi:hypothetical protein
MKKFWHSTKYKRYQRTRQLRSLVQLRRFRLHRLRIERKKNRQRVQRIAHRDGFRDVPYFNVYAPPTFSFVRNPELVIEFIRTLEQCFNERRAVSVRMEFVDQIDYDAITVLLSIMVKFRSEKIPFTGTFPKDSTAQLTIIESGFFDYLYNKEFTVRNRYSLAEGSSIVTHGYTRVDSRLAESVIDAASKTIWGERRRCFGAYGTLIELLLNTLTHASSNPKMQQLWWLSVKHLKEQKRVTFSFVDYGVGVFESLENKPENRRYFGLMPLFRRLFNPRDNAEALKLILQGKLRETESGEPHHGFGLPGMYRSAQSGYISKFAMITNGVYFNSETDESYNLVNYFRGTFVYWELCETDISLPHVNN